MTSRIESYLDDARSHLLRVLPEDLETAALDGALIVDIRPIGDREAEGTMPGAVVIDRNVLEWRLDPTSPDRIDEPLDGRRVILFCNDGYASSLAARTLQLIGVDGATDLVGGYRAWFRTVARAERIAPDRSSDKG
jgi:rhodanese-related sulfurtransferase